MKYILAVSGGPDSMAMLYMYRKKAQAVCVVNYKKRETSDYDVSLVVDFCKLYNIKYYIHNVSKKFYSEHEKENFQTLARQIRYNFFLQICKIENNLNLLIAHNLNDHLETAYMQFKRNSTALYYGIVKKSHYLGLNIKRPLLHLQKTTLERYCNEKNIKFAIDYTNELDIYERNRIRKVILGWSAQQTLDFMRKIKNYNKKNAIAQKQIIKLYALWTKTNFNIHFLNKQTEFNRYYLIYEFLKENGQTNNSKTKIDNIMHFIMNNSGSKQFRLVDEKKLVIKKQCLKITS